MIGVFTFLLFTCGATGHAANASRLEHCTVAEQAPMPEAVHVPIGADGAGPEHRVQPTSIMQSTGDRWFGSDKLRHFLTSFAVTGYAAAGLRTIGAAREDAPGGGAGVAIVLGIGKEIHDVRAGRFFSFRDLAWDIAGVACGLALVAAAR